MSRVELSSGGKPVVARPYAAMLAGLGLVVLAVVVRVVAKTSPGAEAFCVFAGLVVSGAGLAVGLRRWRDDPLAAAGLWALAFVSRALGGQMLADGWSSLSVCCNIFAAFSAFAGIITAMPTRWRRFAISVVIALHFFAVATAVLVVPSTSGVSPFLPHQIWMRYSRPYLQALNLNNAYHFYAPDPGPTTLLWFRVEFADGASRWVRWPDHEGVMSHIERRRYGALATSVSSSIPIPPEGFQKRLEERRKVANIIPFGNMPELEQCREPTLEGKRLLNSYAKYVARTTGHPLDEKHAVKGVKIYRVDYHNPPVEHFQAGQDPLDPTLYHAFYMGEFNSDGTIKPECLQLAFNPATKQTEWKVDPLLYWLIPIVKRIDDDELAQLPRGPDGAPVLAGAKGQIINWVRKHAGDTTEESIP